MPVIESELWIVAPPERIFDLARAPCPRKSA
jgi:hypothetical protein